LPDYAQVYLELGLIDEALKQPQKAAEAFERYLALAPNTSDRAVIQAMVDKNKTLSERKRPTLKGIQ
jgi:tetratricopeptide (TPR) repeat protein